MTMKYFIFGKMILINNKYNNILELADNQAYQEIDRVVKRIMRCLLVLSLCHLQW